MTDELPPVAWTFDPVAGNPLEVGDLVELRTRRGRLRVLHVVTDDDLHTGSLALPKPPRRGGYMLRVSRDSLWSESVPVQYERSRVRYEPHRRTWWRRLLRIG